MAGINRSRGCLIRFHPAGMRVVMYYDSPGVYYDERGDQVENKVAKAAGFDVDHFELERKKQERMAVYREQLEREFASEEEKLAEALSSGSGLEVRHTGGGQYAVFKDGERVTQKPLSQGDAEALVGDLVGDGEEEGESNAGNEKADKTQAAKKGKESKKPLFGRGKTPDEE